MPLQADEFRRHFPIFEDRAHLCSCSEGALSDRVIVAMSEFMTGWRVHGAPWHAWMERVDAARDLFARLIHADPKDVAVVSCASEAAYHVASTLDYGGANRILSCDLEFPSIAHVWLAQGPRGAQVDFVAHRGGVISEDDYLAALRDDTALVSIPLVSYANGLRFPVREVAAAAHRRGARVFVDAYQGAGVMPADVRELDCDYLACGTLKYLLGAPGLAFLYVRPGLDLPADPPLTGWFARREPFAFDPRLLDYAGDARKFQTGTPAIPAAFAGAAGLELLLETDPAQTLEHVLSLGDFLQEELQRRGIGLFSPTDRSRRGPQVSVLAQDAEELGAFLADRGVLVSPRGRAIRVSLHYYNSLDDVRRVLEGVIEYRRGHPM